MNYSDTISSLAQSLNSRFDEVYHSCEIVVNDKGIKFPGVSIDDDWVDLSPTDKKEILYIRRNGNDDVLSELKSGSCSKSYVMKSPIRVVYFKDHAKDHPRILANLMQSVLIGGFKLTKIIRDKWNLQKDESSGDFNFGATTAYFAIDLIAMWELIPSSCDEDICVDIINPLKK